MRTDKTDVVLVKKDAIKIYLIHVTVPQDYIVRKMRWQRKIIMNN